mgnify:CR=1 FL=1
MNKQKVIELNKEFVKLVAENPNLPIKVFVSGDCMEDEEWVVGEIYDCKVTEIAEYEDRCYERDDFDWLKEIISNGVCDDPEYANLTDEEFDKAIEEKVEWLGWERVILLKVDV